ncbi:MAG: ribosome maturation factor RimM [Cyanobacteria bacterium P01_F01_bin.53]
MPDQQQNKQQNQQQDDWLLIGRVVGAHGLNGHIKVQPESDFPERFEVPGDRWLKKPGAEPVQIKLTSGRYLEGKRQYLVKLAGVDYRDQAEDLRSAQLLVKESDRIPLDPGEFHVSDLIGLTVVMQADQSTVGTVQDVYTTGHDMLEVVVSPELLSQLSEEGEAENQQTAKEEIAREETGQEETTEPASDTAHPSTRTKAAQKLRKRKARKKKKKKVPKTLLIPFVEEIVPTVDIASGRIEITPPPGLIDL